MQDKVHNGCYSCMYSKVVLLRKHRFTAMILTCLCLKMRYSALKTISVTLISLFTFQVEIVLETIIGRTVEQSMTEVQHEEEILRARYCELS